MKLNHIYCMDNVEGLRQHVPDESIDLTVTSPPYDTLRTYNGFSFDFEALAHELYRVTKPGGVVVWIVDDETKDFCESLTSFKQAIYFVDDVGFKLLDTMIYKKSNYAPAYPTLRRYANQFEYMFVFVKSKKPKTFNPIKLRKSDKTIKRQKRHYVATFRTTEGERILKKIETDSLYKDASNVWEYATGSHSSRDKIAFQHPAIFPEKLAEDHIISWSNPGDVVLDPFMGSGTTAKMALLNNRYFVGFEISPEYVAIAEQRIRETKKQPLTG